MHPTAIKKAYNGIIQGKLERGKKDNDVYNHL